MSPASGSERALPSRVAWAFTNALGTASFTQSEWVLSIPLMPVKCSRIALLSTNLLEAFHIPLNDERLGGFASKKVRTLPAHLAVDAAPLRRLPDRSGRVRWSLFMVTT